MELVMPMPSPDMDFDFSGARTSPYLSAPSSPKRFGEYYTSAPTSPSRLSEFYHDFDHFSIEGVSSSSSSIAFGWEEKSAGTTTKGASIGDDDDDNDFAFFVSQESEKSSRSAEELFDGGKIKHFKPPSRLGNKELTSPKSPRQPRSSITQRKEITVDAFSPNKEKETEPRRGRDRTPAAVLSSSNSGRRVTRSHSPYRVSHNMWEEEQNAPPKRTKEEESSSDSRPVVLSNATSSKSSRKWSFRDFLLFRSASEGRGASKDTLRNSLMYRKLEDGKNSSFRSIDSHSSASGHGSRRRGPISAHELHYTMKKAESQDLKKKTFLPYKQGILGRLAGLGSFTK